MPKVNTQTIKFDWKGEYDPSTQYVKKDVVSYRGQSFVCDTDAVGVDPTTTSHWSKHNSASNLVDINPTENALLQFDGSGFTAVSSGTAGNLIQSQGSSAPIWSALNSPVKEVFYRNVTDATIGNIASNSDVDYFSFTPTVDGMLFVGYTFCYRSNPSSSNYHYFQLDFNNGSTWYNNLRQDGYNRATSGSGDHLQTAKATTMLNDITNLRAVAGTTQQFRLQNNSSGTAGTSNQGSGWRMSWVAVVI